MKCNLFVLIVSYILLISNINAQKFLGDGSVDFISKAPLETIRANSNKLRGVIDVNETNFAFSFPVNSFDGFNSPLQKEHFNEYYLETRKFPKATFEGKILGLKECPETCSIEVFAKGKMNIHGVSKIMTIPLKLEIEKNKIRLKTNFEVLLADHDISIPRILEAKISPLIAVTVTADFNTTDE